MGCSGCGAGAKVFFPRGGLLIEFTTPHCFSCISHLLLCARDGHWLGGGDRAGDGSSPAAPTASCRGREALPLSLCSALPCFVAEEMVT